MERVSRRNFFGEALRAGIRTLGQAVGGETGAAPAPADIGSLSGDFPPELLAMEAERLGLDPETDRDELLRAVHTAMGGSGPPG